MFHLPEISLLADRDVLALRVGIFCQNGIIVPTPTMRIVYVQPPFVAVFEFSEGIQAGHFVSAGLIARLAHGGLAAGQQRQRTFGLGRPVGALEVDIQFVTSHAPVVGQLERGQHLKILAKQHARAACAIQHAVRPMAQPRFVSAKGL
ncbi:unknown [Prevotella sp. CAG:617]|nr:unknown [Prevotella sp. CAG:617]